MSDIVIRELEPEDVSKGFLDTLEALAPSCKNGLLAMSIARSIKHSFRTFVAVTAVDRVVGTATSFVERKFIHNGGRAGHIEDVAVHQDYQGKGVGRMLIEAAVKFCKDSGCYKVILDCDESKIDFYKKCGFRQNGVAMRLDLQ